MMRIELDCTDWQDASAAWTAVLCALDAPDWHGRNLDALLDGLSGGLVRADRPLELFVRGHATPEVRALLFRMAGVFDAAREDRGEDVRLTVRTTGSPKPAQARP